ncbi:hypothetical protein [Flexithrix dorotheae]|uniref:hypothetical protein n=1 Tax=Flexithrix dorotheae TaxID=70993 RepID=UPI0012FB2C73|nr:hypothetical protein [Flexithrix dorotheae]
MARNAAIKYVKERLLKPNGYFNFYIVIVGEDKNHGPETIYTDVLPIDDQLITDTKTAINIFHAKCNPEKEFLVKVKFNSETKNLIPEILHIPRKF